ncbi:MAG: S8 family serine peptidase [Patescibacteria group bacterium]
MIHPRIKLKFTSFKITSAVLIVAQMIIVFSFGNIVLAYDNKANYVQLALVPNDPGYDYQMNYLEKIKAPQVWEKVQTTSLRPVIAILDSGVDVDNPDLQGNIWFNAWEVPGDKQDNDRNGYIDDQYGWDFINNVPDPRPKFEDGWTEIAMQHGTVVAGVAAAVGNNAQGVAGISWSSRIMPLRVLDAKGVGNTVIVARAINYAVDNGADIINLSFVGPFSDPILEEAIRHAYQVGVLVVAASGTEQSLGINLNKQPQYPVCDDGFNGENQVIGVAAVDGNDKLADFSNYGSRCIDISAPGVKIFSTQFKDSSHKEFNDAYGGWWNGTSVAAPMVSGALALLKAAFPKYSPSQLRDIIIASGDQIDFYNPSTVGQIGRRLNLEGAFKLAGDIKFAKKNPIVVAPASGAKAEVQVFDISGEKITSFLAYHPRFVGGINVAVGDVDGDGQADIVTAPRLGGGPHLKIFSQRGELASQFMAFPEVFHGGISIALGDFNDDKKDEIVVGTGKGGVPVVRIFSFGGELIYQFSPYDNLYLGGVKVAAGDVDGNGIPEIIVTPQTGSLPVRVFDKYGRLRSEFKAYPTGFKGGVNVTVGDVDGNGIQDIVSIPGQGGGPQVRVFNWQGKALNQFFVFDRKFRGGVNVAVGDVDGDGNNEIVTTPASAGGPHLRVFTYTGEVRSNFFIQPENFRGGLTVAVFR